MKKNQRDRNKTKIHRWLKNNGMTPKDIGLDVPLSKASDECLASILDDIAEEKAREAGREEEKREEFEYLIAEED